MTDILDVFAKGICDFYEQNHLQEASNRAELDGFKAYYELYGEPPVKNHKLRVRNYIKKYLGVYILGMLG